jgi:hypothetical protein
VEYTNTSYVIALVDHDRFNRVQEEDTRVVSLFEMEGKKIFTLSLIACTQGVGHNENINLSYGTRNHP